MPMRDESVSYFLALCLFYAAIIAIGYALGFLLVPVTLVSMHVGRKIGWWLSRQALCTSPLAIAAPLCVAWGAFVAVILQSIILAYPAGVLAHVFAFGAGLYVAFPAYGLLADPLSSPILRSRQLFIDIVPVAAFIAVSFWLWRDDALRAFGLL
jgi:hypothetical protein